MKDLRARANRAIGLASPALIRDACPGAVYTVDDAAIAFPESRLATAGPRSLHPTRYAIVFQAAAFCTSARPATVFVVPCSSSSRAGPFDLELPSTEAAFPEKTVAFPSLAQPILKSDLKAFKGDVTALTLRNLQEIVLKLMGIVGQNQLSAPEPVADEVVVAAVAPSETTV